jgi:glutamine synthetase
VGLLAPGKDAKGNLQFVTFFVNILAAVQKHNGLLKASVASANNSHRLGAQEAPPAIVSAFLGQTMTDVLHQLLELPSGTPIVIAGKKGRRVGVEIPEIFVDNTDRNRTSPFAFTGNRFEFRAVGSSANCAGALTVLSAAVAQQLIEFKAAVDKEMADGKAMDIAVMDVLKPLIASILDTICFEGNGYSDAWKKEAKKRGLDVESSVPKMFCQFTAPESVKLFTQLGVYSEKELEARNDVKWDTYSTKVLIEARMAVRMAINHVMPAGMEYQRRLLEDLDLLRQNFPNDYQTLAATQTAFIRECSALLSEIKERADKVSEAQKVAEGKEGSYAKAVAAEKAADALSLLRESIDKLEEITDNALWPLPKYREILFIN